MELIDGQHRLFGFMNVDAQMRANYPLLVAGVLDVPESVRRSIFISINDNSRRMDPNLVAYLKYTEADVQCQSDPELMAIRIAVGLNDNSALAGRIRLLDLGNQPLTLKGVSGYDLRTLVRETGSLAAVHGHTYPSYLRIFRLYFSVIKSVFPREFDDPSTYILCTNRGISAFLKLLRSIVRTEQQALDQRTIRVYLEALRQEWPADDWRTQNLAGRYQGAAGWSAFHRDLKAAIRRQIPQLLD